MGGQHRRCGRPHCHQNADGRHAGRPLSGHCNSHFDVGAEKRTHIADLDHLDWNAGKRMICIKQSIQTKLTIISIPNFQLGSMVSRFFSGILLHHYRDWHTVFYCFGSVGLVLTLLYVNQNNPFAQMSSFLIDLTTLFRNRHSCAAPVRTHIHSSPIMRKISCIVRWAVREMWRENPKRHGNRF